MASVAHPQGVRLSVYAHRQPLREFRPGASFRVSALFLDTTGVDLSLSMNIVDENLDDAEDIEIL